MRQLGTDQFRVHIIRVVKYVQLISVLASTKYIIIGTAEYVRKHRRELLANTVIKFEMPL